MNAEFSMLKSFPKFGMGLLALAIAALPMTLSAAPNIAVAKYAKGNVRITAGEQGERELQASDLVVSGSKIEAGQDGKAILRFLPDNAFLEIRSKTVFKVRRTKNQDKRLRRIYLETGEVVFGLRKKSDAVQCENTNTVATTAKGRFSCRVDENAAGILIVQDGEVSVYNRPKDITVVVRSGQKAVSDLTGIKVTDATDSELEQVGFRQNTLEVDFLNPQSEEFTTLEVEYETTF